MQLFGCGAASLLASACLGGCSGSAGSDSTPVPAATGVNTTLDLAAATSAPLNDAAVGYVYADSRAVIVAKTTTGAYLAFQAPCPHQGTAVYSMRTLVFFFGALLMATRLPAQDTAPPLTWTSDLTTALQQAQASQKPVLVVFSGSDWCKPCMLLKQEVFDRTEFARFAQDKLVLARFDFPRNKKNRLPDAQTKRNEDAAAKLNKDGAFPAVVLLSPEGKVLARLGYRSGGAPAYDAYLSQLLVHN